MRIVAVQRVGQFDELFQGFAVRGNDVNTSQVLRPFLVQFSVKGRASKKQNGRHSHPGQYIDRVVVSKINCSKNDARSVGKIRPKNAACQLMGTPPREQGEFRVATGKAVVGD